jgi:hypothetical protein
MTEHQYGTFRRAHPELRLPFWDELREIDQTKAHLMTEEELYTRRSAVLLGRDPGVVDVQSACPLMMVTLWQDPKTF